MELENLNKQPFIYIVDDIDENLQVLGNILYDYGYEVSMANNGTDALEILNWDELPDLILLDVMMPDIDGFEVCKKLKKNSALVHIPVIFLTAKAEPESVIEGFRAGGVDYVTKPFQREELMARIETHLELKFSRESLLKKSQQLEELNDKLKSSEKQLKKYVDALRRTNEIKDKYLKRIVSDLENAENYVKSIIPNEINDEKICTQWKFEPSTQLGGDIFGYYKLDENKYAVYLIDVCGHGIDATLHAVSVINTIKYRNLNHTDFSDPADVLSNLNKIYQLTEHNHLYFTAWYGVIDLRTNILSYSGAGHPPVLLFRNNEELIELPSQAMMVGGMPDTKYVTEKIQLFSGNFFYLYSDGVYEVKSENNEQFTYNKLADFLINAEKRSGDELNQLYQYVNEFNREEKLKDDFSILKVLIL